MFTISIGTPYLLTILVLKFEMGYELLARLGIEDLDLILKERRLLWYGYVEPSSGVVKTALTYRLMESVGLGGPR